MTPYDVKIIKFSDTLKANVFEEASSENHKIALSSAPFSHQNFIKFSIFFFRRLPRPNFLIFFNTFRNFFHPRCPKVRFWDPLWRPAGAKLAAKIAKIAKNVKKFLGGRSRRTFFLTFGSQGPQDRPDSQFY